VVDVTHHGDHRRPRLQEVGVLVDLSFDVDGERLEQFLVLLLGRDDLDVESQFGAVAVAISPRWNSTVTKLAGLALIFSAKSVSDAPRRSRTIVEPSPRGTCTPPGMGACMLSNS
jgi:hypothetical protein